MIDIRDTPLIDKTPHDNNPSKKTINPINLTAKEISSTAKYISFHRPGTSSLVSNPLLQTNPFRPFLTDEEMKEIINISIQQGSEMQRNLDEEERLGSFQLQRKANFQQIQLTDG